MSHSSCRSFVALAVLVLASSAARSDIYKWVDEKGQTHYGERKPGSGSAGVSTVKVAPPPPTAAVTAPSPDFSGQGKLDTPYKPVAKKPETPAAKPPKAVSDGRDHGTDQSRCALARDILNGALRHANGNPIDQHDLDTARNDVRMFCK